MRSEEEAAAFLLFNSRPNEGKGQGSRLHYEIHSWTFIESFHGVSNLSKNVQHPFSMAYLAFYLCGRIKGANFIKSLAAGCRSS